MWVAEAGGHVATGRWLPDRVTDPHGAEAADRRHLAGPEHVPARGAGRGEDPDRGGLGVLPAPDRHALARPERAGEQADVRHALSRGRPLDLEDPPRDVRIGVAAGPAQQLVDAREECIDPDPPRGGPDIDGVDRAGPGLDPEALAQTLGREGRWIADERIKDGLVVLGKRLDQGGTTGVGRRPRRQDPRRQPSLHLGHDTVHVCPRAVDLVDEDQGRDVDPLQRAEQQRRLRLDALHRRDDEDRPVQDAKDAFDLGDEVGVAGRVDEVDREVAQEERGDRGPDGDAAFAFEIERVGLGRAGVDAADLVDGAGGEEEALGESGLTGVDVGEDAEVERAHGTSCRARRC